MTGQHPRQALVADIGGTNARFAIADIDELTIAHFAAFRCALFPSLEAAVEAYLASIPHRPAMAGFAIAGPVSGETLRLTNRDWTFSRESLLRATGTARLHLVNDFEALALSLPRLGAHDLHPIGGGAQALRGAKVVLGPGTGLGVAGLADTPSGWVGLPGEGGHVSFPAQTADELAILDSLRGEEGYVSAEHLISGPGLAAAYRALGGKGGETAPEITKAALAGEDAVAERALALFVVWLGRFAGDMALVYGARGGVYLGGGIAPRIVAMLEAGGFRRAFEAKGRLSSYLEAIPVQVITAADAGLRGAAVALSVVVARADSAH